MTMISPIKITIITPSFNQGDFLEETILSVLDQNYPNLEYIIIDGGSTDRSPEIIRKYSKHLSYWISEKDHGQSEAINKGLKRATGDVIAWLCSDDLYLPGTLSKVSEEFRKNPGAGLIHGRTLLFKNTDGITLEKGAEQEDLYLKYFATIPFSQPSSFFSKQIFLEQGYLDEQLHFAMDYDLFISIALHYPMISVPHVFSKYRIHDASKSVRNIPAFLDEWCMVFSKFINSIPGHRDYEEILKAGGLFYETRKSYQFDKVFSADDMKKIVLYFLQNQLHGSYTVLNKNRVRNILRSIHKYYPAYYNSAECSKIRFRNQFIPVFLLRKIRKWMDTAPFS